MAARPLTGVRVLDFTWVRAGPWATRWLAVLGAEVIKVEWPDPRLPWNGRVGGTGYGRGGPAAAAPGPNSSGSFSDGNASKRSITVNVRSPKGFEVIRRLLAVSDVVVENFSFTVMQDWGLGYEEMAKIKADIIYVSMAGFGHSGRDVTYTTLGPSVQALSGLTFLSGLPGAPPAGWGWSYMDDTGGLYGAMSALTALLHRQATGEGQHVDMSQVAAGMTLTGPALLDVTVNGRGSRREGYPPGNRTHWPGTALVNNYRGPTTVPHNAYRTAGGGHNDWCVVACFSDGEWRSLIEVMGSPVWATNPELTTLLGRLEHQEEIDRGIEAWTLTLDKYEVMARCQAAGVGAMPVQSSEDRVEHDLQLREQGMYTPVPHAVVGTFPLQHAPFALSKTPVPIERAGPLVGEHNLEILGGMLGLSREDLQAGYEDGTFWPKNVPIEPYLLSDLEQTTVRS